MEEILQNKKTKIIAILGGIVFALLLVFLIGIDNTNHNEAIQNVNNRYADEMAECWKEVEGTGKVCEMKYIYDDGVAVSAQILKK